MAQAERPVIRIAVIVGGTAARRACTQVLGEQSDMTVVGGFDSADAFLAEPRLLGDGQCDVVVTDLVLPGSSGLELVKHLAVNHPVVASVVLGDDADARTLSRVLTTGAAGYLTPDPTDAMLVAAVRAAYAGLAVSSLKGACAIRRLANDNNLVRVQGSRRETWELVAYGHSNSEIAVKLFMSESTVKHQVSSLMKQLGVRNRVELTNLYWQRESILEPNASEAASSLATLDE